MTVSFEVICLEKPACFLNDGNEFPNQIVNHVCFTYHVYYSQANAITAMLLHNLPRHALLYREQVHSKIDVNDKITEILWVIMYIEAVLVRT